MYGRRDATTMAQGQVSLRRLSSLCMLPSIPHMLVSHSSSLQASHARASLGLVEVRSGVHPELQRNMVPH